LNAIRSRPEFDDVPDRLTNAMAILNIYVLEGFLAFSGIHQFTIEETIDAARLLSVLTRNLPTIADDFDWDSTAK
jgi:hypothetical protein